MSDLEAGQVRNLVRKVLGGGKMKYSVNLLGVGGVGSNILWQACRAPYPERLIFKIYDHDTIELHNLNRTMLFDLDTVGQQKVGAAARACSRRTRLEQNGREPMVRVAQAQRVDGTHRLQMGTIIDARDTLDPTAMLPGTWIKLAYNGGSEISFTWKPEVVVHKIIDLNPGRSSYEVVPSFFVPAALLTVATFNFMRFLNFLEITDHRAGTFFMDIDELVDQTAYYWDPEGETE
jgi:hypothetical protein